MTDHDDDRCHRCHRRLHSDLSRLAGHGQRCAQLVFADRPRRQRPEPDGQLALLDDREDVE